MRFRLPQILAAATVLGPLAGCSDYQRAERPPWRARAEEVCLAKGVVTETASIRPFHALNGPGICGAVHPFKVTALDGGSVALNSTQTLDCPMIAALDTWVREVVQPAAETRFGERVVRIDSMGSYNCRGINNMSGAGLSEHAFANAIDIGGFTLASGRTLNIMRGFNGPDEQERAFLHEAHAGACGHFTTVLGPGYNIFHYNHFHLDLALHGSTARGPRRYCKPVPQKSLPEPPAKDAMPDPPAIEEEMDIARTPLPAPSYRSGPPTLMASVPLPAPALHPTRPLPDTADALAAPPPEETMPAVRRPAALPLARPPRALALASEPQARPARTLRPLATGPEEEPLISFGGPAHLDDPPPSSRGPRAPAGLRPPLALARTPPGPRPKAWSEPDGEGGSATEPPAPSAGSPRDWDITSRIDR